MIEFKQKEFKTGPIARAIFRLKNAGNSVKRARFNAGNDLLKSLTTDQTKKLELEGLKKGVGKTKFQLKKEAVKAEHKAQEAGKEVARLIATKQGNKDLAAKALQKGENVSEYFRTHTPGDIVASGTDRFIKDPVKTTVMATMPIPGVPTISLGLPIAAGVGKAEAYKKVTDAASKAYNKPLGKRGHSLKDYTKAIVDNTVRTFPA